MESSRIKITLKWKSFKSENLFQENILASCHKSLLHTLPYLVVLVAFHEELDEHGKLALFLLIATRDWWRTEII